MVLVGCQKAVSDCASQQGDFSKQIIIQVLLIVLVILLKKQPGIALPVEAFQVGWEDVERVIFPPQAVQLLRTAVISPECCRGPSVTFVLSKRIEINSRPD